MRLTHLLMLLWVYVVGCGPPAPPQIEALRREGQGVVLTLAAPVEGAVIEVETSQGQPVMAWPPAAALREMRLLLPPVEEGLRVRVRAPGGEDSATLAPARPPHPLEVKVGAPWGQGEALLGEQAPLSLLPAGSAVQLGVQISALDGVDRDVVLRWSLPPELGGPLPEQRAALRGWGARRLLLTELRLPPTPGTFRLGVELSWEEGGAPQHLQGEVHLSTRPAEEMASLVTLEGLLLPVDARGEPRPERLPDTISLPGSFWRAVSRLLSEHPLALDPYAPAAHQAAVLHNTSPVDVTLLLRGEVRGEGGEVLEEFQPRVQEELGAPPVIAALCRVPSGARVACLLPVYAREDTAPGHYTRHVSATLLGQGGPLFEVQRPLIVHKEDTLAAWMLVGCSALAALGIGMLLAFQRRWLARIGLEELAAAAVFSALLFGSGLVTEVLMLVTAALLGPLNVVVAALPVEVVGHALLTCALVLQPRVGVLTLIGLTSVLLRAVLTGQLSPTDPIFLAPTLASRELLLWVFGVTRGGRSLPPTVGSFVRVGLALGLAGALAGFTSLTLHTAFYRLFFAPWYVALNVVIGGLYPLPGIWLGLKLGQDLKKVGG